MEIILFSSVKLNKYFIPSGASKYMSLFFFFIFFFISTPVAVAQPLALLGSDVLPLASSFSTSPCTRNPEDTSINILENVV